MISVEVELLDEQTENGFDEVHTATHPYCGDIDCWCHNDADYHTIVIMPLASDDEVEAAYTFFELEVTL